MNILKALFGSKVETPQEERKAEEARDFDVLKYDGVRALRTGQTAYATECFRRALDIKDDLEVRDYLSQAFIRQGALAEAFEQLQLMSEAEPENVAIYLRKADVAYMMENYQAVAEACERALVCDKDNAMALYLYGKACMGMGDDVNAVAMFTKAMAMEENFGDALLMRAKANLRLGENEQAKEDAEELLAKHPDNEDVLLLAADVEKAFGHTEEALLLYNKVTDVNPFSSVALMERAQLKRLLGDEAGAEDDLRAYKEINPEADDENIAQRVEDQNKIFDPFGIG